MELATLKQFALWLFCSGCHRRRPSHGALSPHAHRRDDTDMGSWGGGRSGIKPVTDALTGGCQYPRFPAWRQYAAPGH
jgi:hypothetical protein